MAKRKKPEVTDVKQIPDSPRSVVIDSYKKPDNDVHFNFGFMPGHSYRCLNKKCREGFHDPDDNKTCPKCGSKRLTPHSTEVVK